MKLSINLDRRRAYWDGTELSLRRREFDVLAYLFLNFGKVVARQAILQDIYKMPDNGKSSRAVDNAVKRLRKKLPEPVIQTEWGVGYRLEEKP